MPGMTGGALRERVREASPDLAERFVFMTGVGFGRELTELRSSGAPVLEKPFSLTQALREIRRVAEKNPPPAWRLP
jgi:FixJ family two-component response regulator